MKVLYDSHLLVWLIGISAKLPREARRLVEAQGNSLFFSSASIWELTIKFASGRADFTFPPTVLRDGLLDFGFNELPITSMHGLGVAALPPIHKDPFDRILVAQAITENMILLTSDEAVGLYGAPVRLVR